MHCTHARELLHRSLDGLPADSTLRDHLAACPDCRARLSELRQTARLLGELGPVPAPPGFLTGVMAAVQHQRQTQAARNPWQRLVTTVAAAAALLGLLLISASALGEEPVPTSQAEASAGEEALLGLAEMGDVAEAPPPALADPLGFAQRLLTFVEEAGTLLLGLGFFFVSGTAALVRLLAPDLRRPAAGPVSLS